MFGSRGSVLRWILLVIGATCAPFFHGKSHAGLAPPGLESQDSLDPLLWIAARDGRLVEINDLVEKGANVNDRMVDGMTPLMEASAHCHSEAVRLLLRLGSNPNVTDPDGRTALIYAASEGCAEVIQAILNVPGIDFGHRDNAGLTALNYAYDYAQLGDPEAAKKVIALLKHPIFRQGRSSRSKRSRRE